MRLVGPACDLSGPHSFWQPCSEQLSAHVDRVNAQLRPQTPQYLTIGIRGAHKPRDNRLPNQESPPNREPGSTARSAADVSQPGPLDAANDDGVRLAVQRTTRPQQTRSHATTRGAINGGTHRQVPRRQQLTSPTQRPTTPEREPLAQRPTSDAAASMVRRTNKRPTDTTDHSAQRRTPWHIRPTTTPHQPRTHHAASPRN